MHVLHVLDRLCRNDFKSSTIIVFNFEPAAPKIFCIFEGNPTKAFFIFSTILHHFSRLPTFFFIFQFSDGCFFQLKLIQVGGRPEGHEGGDGYACDLELRDSPVGEHDDDHHLEDGGEHDDDYDGDVTVDLLGMILSATKLNMVWMIGKGMRMVKRERRPSPLLSLSNDLKKFETQT